MVYYCMVFLKLSGFNRNVEYRDYWVGGFVFYLDLLNVSEKEI